jgi:hypothetical protein
MARSHISLRAGLNVASLLSYDLHGRGRKSCRDGKYISGFFFHRCAQRGNGLLKALLLEQDQSETKVQLIPSRLELYRLLNLFGCFALPGLPFNLDRIEHTSTRLLRVSQVEITCRECRLPVVCIICSASRASSE